MALFANGIIGQYFAPVVSSDKCSHHYERWQNEAHIRVSPNQVSVRPDWKITFDESLIEIIADNLDEGKIVALDFGRRFLPSISMEIHEAIVNSRSAIKALTQETVARLEKESGELISVRADTRRLWNHRHNFLILRRILPKTLDEQIARLKRKGIVDEIKVKNNPDLIIVDGLMFGNSSVIPGKRQEKDKLFISSEVYREAASRLNRNEPQVVAIHMGKVNKIEVDTIFFGKGGEFDSKMEITEGMDSSKVFENGHDWYTACAIEDGDYYILYMTREMARKYDISTEE